MSAACQWNKLVAPSAASQSAVETILLSKGLRVLKTWRIEAFSTLRPAMKEVVQVRTRNENVMKKSPVHSSAAETA